MLMQADRALLLVVDIQEKLTPAVHGLESMLSQVSLLLRTAAVLEIPVVVSEQYPRGLGVTLPQVQALYPPGTRVLDKVHFSCLGDPALAAALLDSGRDQIVVCGMEAHVCVLQTVLHLRERGVATFVVADACTSRTAANHRLGLNRMAAAGAHIVSAEMVFFEGLQRSGTPAFKALSPLLR